MQKLWGKINVNHLAIASSREDPPPLPIHRHMEQKTNGSLLHFHVSTDLLLYTIMVIAA